VNLNACKTETLDEAVVRDAVLASSGVDALDPEATEVALALATVTVCVNQRVGDLLLGLAVEARTLTAVAGRALKDDATLLVGVYRPLDSCHFPVFLFVRSGAQPRPRSLLARSEERRVGKECRWRWSASA